MHYPLVGGDRVKTYHLIRHLSVKNDLTVVTYENSQKESMGCAIDPSEWPFDLYTVKFNKKKAYSSIVINALSNIPIEIYYYTQKDYANLVTELTRSNSFDLLISYFTRTIEFGKNIPIRKLLILDDCRSLYQYRSYQSSTELIQKALRYSEYLKLRKYEADNLRNYDLVTVVSEHEAMALNGKIDPRKLRILSNGVDLNDFAMPRGHTGRRNIVFSGRLDLWANQLMIERIVNDIFPTVRREIEGVKLILVGGNPGRRIRRLEGDDIEVRADVASVAPYLREAALFLHPHSGGSGIQNKLLEAMACGCPIVTTPTGIHGIGVSHGKEVLIGASNRELAELSIGVLRNEHLAADLARSARLFVEQNHTWETVFRSMDEAIEQLFR